jgi:diaminopimelate decarboxylase
VAEQIKLTHYKHGDFLVFKASGAYRINLTPFFINPRCAIVKMTEDGYEVLRKRQDAKHLLDMLQ